MRGQIEPELLADILGLLRNWPANGKPVHTDALLGATLAGLVEAKEITRPCRECGTPRLDYSFMQITTAGKFLLQALDAAGIETRSATTAGRGPQDESPIAESEPPKGGRHDNQ